MLAAGLEGAAGQGTQNYARLLQLNKAMQQAKQTQLARGALGDYMQSALVPPPQTPAPGQPSVPMQQPGAKGAPASPTQEAAQAPSQPGQMSLEGLMGFLKQRGITGADALATADQFSPYLAAEDRQKLGEMKFQADMTKLLIANGFDEAKAKNEAARVAAYRERTKAMYGKGGSKDQLKALTYTVNQLTVGRQKLQKQASDIVNLARNAGRMLTPREKQAINAINQKIQTVDNGMAAARQQQSLLAGGLNYGAQPDSMGQADDSTSSSDAVDTGDLGDTGGGP